MDHHKVNGSPEYCCAYCGEAYGHRDCSEYATWHIGACDVCGDEEVPVTEPRDYGGLNDLWKGEA